MTDDRWAVLLLAHGAPDRLEDIPEFLLNVRGGRPLPDSVMREIVYRYRLIGGGSPLLAITRQQANALADRLELPVYIGMRNWSPFIAEAVRRLNDDGLTHVVAICLAPQNSRTSIGLYRRHLMEAVAATNPRLHVEFVESWHNRDELIAAFADRVSTAIGRIRNETGGSVPLIFTGHSVPQKTIDEGDPYETQVIETARLVAERTLLDNWRVAFQSQGMTAGPWIGPTVESQIELLAAAGERHVLVVPVSFVSDHVEILYDVDVMFREYGSSKGVTVWRSESLNDSPLFIVALARLATTRMRPAHTRAGV